LIQDTTYPRGLSRDINLNFYTIEKIHRCVVTQVYSDILCSKEIFTMKVNNRLKKNDKQDWENTMLLRSSSFTYTKLILTSCINYKNILIYNIT